MDTRKLSAALWIILGLLVFLFTGIMKLTTPIEMLTAQVPLPVAFVRFLGLAETSAPSASSCRDCFAFALA